MKKIAFVVQRYGEEINGGSELHCRQVAERMAAYYDVTVYTSCALDYVTWKNEYAPGDSEINGVHVKRFATDKPRKQKKFDKVAAKAYTDGHNFWNGVAFQEAQGPFCPELVNQLSRDKHLYNAILFMTYLYYPTFWGIHVAPERSILIPTAHDEPPLYLNLFHSLFMLPRYIVYNTYTEKQMVNKRFYNHMIPSTIAGVGIELDENTPEEDMRKKFGFDGDYALYLGRIDTSKGCADMFEQYIRYREEGGRPFKLVLAGKSVMDIPSHPDIVSLGFVSDEEKINLLRQANFLWLPSQYESLSMCTLESMLLRIPVLLNGNCEVLRQHVLNSDGGVYYTDYDTAKEGIETLLGQSAEDRAAMGEKGRAYVESNYRWDGIIEKIRNAVEYVDSLHPVEE